MHCCNLERFVIYEVWSDHFDKVVPIYRFQVCRPLEAISVQDLFSTCHISIQEVGDRSFNVKSKENHHIFQTWILKKLLRLLELIFVWDDFLENWWVGFFHRWIYFDNLDYNLRIWHFSDILKSLLRHNFRQIPLLKTHLKIPLLI